MPISHKRGYRFSSWGKAELLFTGISVVLYYLYSMIDKMKTKIRGKLLALLLLFSNYLPAQEADTTSVGYKIGYHIGSWLPFAVIVILALMVILRASRQHRQS